MEPSACRSRGHIGLCGYLLVPASRDGRSNGSRRALKGTERACYLTGIDSPLPLIWDRYQTGDRAMQNQDIRILARPQMNPAKCDFGVDRSVTEGVIFFPDASSAEGSPLPEDLFKLDGVIQILIREKTVTVTKHESVPWTDLAKKIGAAIRERLQAGGPVIKEGVGGGSAKDEEIRSQVCRIVEDEINPAIAAHDGYVEIINVKGGVVYIKMGGGCQGCASSSATLRMGVEQSIRARVPEVLEILDVTDHDSGLNPYHPRY